MTNNEYQETVNSLIEKFSDRPVLLRKWLEVFMSNTLGELGYDQKTYTELSLREGWSLRVEVEDDRGKS